MQPMLLFKIVKEALLKHNLEVISNPYMGIIANRVMDRRFKIDFLVIPPEIAGIDCKGKAMIRVG